MQRLEAYGKAHWKELLALALAAIPAFFLLFHKGTQQAAQTAISYPAALFGGGGVPSPPPPTAPAAAAKCPPGYIWVPPNIVKLGAGVIAASDNVGVCVPNPVASPAAPPLPPAGTTGISVKAPTINKTPTSATPPKRVVGAIGRRSAG